MTISKEVIDKYAKLANIFIETGTHTGKTTELARQAGFKAIYTIELSDKFYNNAVQRFMNHKEVYCIHGDSAVKIKEVLRKINQKAVFWLDGHWSMGDTARGNQDVPLLDELEAIKNHNIKDHILLIDDVRLWGEKKEQVTGWHDLSLEKVKNKCLEINPKYNFFFEDGHVKNDILVVK